MAEQVRAWEGGQEAAGCGGTQGGGAGGPGFGERAARGPSAVARAARARLRRRPARLLTCLHRPLPPCFPLAAEVRARRHDPRHALPAGVGQVRPSPGVCRASCLAIPHARPPPLVSPSAAPLLLHRPLPPGPRAAALHRQLTPPPAAPALAPALVQRPGPGVCGAHDPPLVPVEGRQPHLRRLLPGPGKPRGLPALRSPPSRACCCAWRGRRVAAAGVQPRCVRPALTWVRIVPIPNPAPPPSCQVASTLISIFGFNGYESPRDDVDPCQVGAPRMLRRGGGVGRRASPC